MQPDILYVSENRAKEIVSDYRVEEAPDLIIEILSPSTAIYDLRQKKDIYEKYGVNEYIVVDPVSRNADLYVLKDSAYYLHQKADEKGRLYSLILSGFSIELSEIFN